MMRMITVVLSLLIATACSSDRASSEWDLLSFHWVADSELIDARICLLPDGQQITVEPEALLGIEHVKSARVEDEGNGDYHVVLQLDSAGSARLREVTAQGVGRHLAIVIDGTIVSMPEVVRAIDSDELPLMHSTLQAADDLARRINDEVLARTAVVEVS
jgi:preprotein translocase subunit SecD